MSTKMILPCSIAFLLIGFLIQLGMPWYSMAFLALIFGFGFRIRPLFSFLLFLLLGGLLWSITAYWKDSQTQQQLSGRISILFGVNNALILIAATALIGGLTSGLGAWCGSVFGKYLRQ